MCEKNKDIKLTPETPLYRIMPLEQLLDMLINKHNVLVRPDKWEDPYEKMLKKSSIKLYFDGREVTEIESLEWDNWFGQCWSYTKECDGMWRSFTHNKEVRSVKIKTSKGKLEDTYKNGKDGCRFFLEKVEYLEVTKDENNFLNILKKLERRYLENNTFSSFQEMAAFALLLIKRKAFCYENEVRLLSCSPLRLNEKEAIDYNIGDSLANGLIEEIELDPWTPPYELETYRDLFTSLIDIPREKIDISKLYLEPKAGYKLTMEIKKDGQVKNVECKDSTIIVSHNDGTKTYLFLRSPNHSFSPVKSTQENRP